MAIGIGSDWGNDTPPINIHKMEYESKIRFFNECIKAYDKDLQWGFEHMGYTTNVLSLIKRPLNANGSYGLEVVCSFSLNLSLHDYKNEWEMKCELIDSACKEIFKSGIGELKSNYKH